MDVRVDRIALVPVDQDEAARIAPPFDPPYRIHAGERRQHHRILARQRARLLRLAVLVHLDDVHLAVAHLGDLRVDDPADVALAELGFHQALESPTPPRPMCPMYGSGVT